MSTPTSLLWFRRDLRVSDHPALAAAAADGDVLAVFVVDPILMRSSGPVRREWLRRSLEALNASLDGKLCIASGDPTQCVPAVAGEVKASRVYATADFGTYGKRRDTAVSKALVANGIEFVHVGSPYAVPPNTAHTKSGSRFRVFTPFYRSWLTQLPIHSFGEQPMANWVIPPTAEWGSLDNPDFPANLLLPDVGEAAALARWRNFADEQLGDYATQRDRPDLDGTSQLSAHLRWGEIHPNTLLRDLSIRINDPSQSTGAEAFRRELAWRDFYADVWDANPQSSWRSLDRRFDDDLEVEAEPLADERFEAWRLGLTGYPIVDAGMRQLRTIGWMHNRVRMIVASFLVKDLHLPWQRGAAEFMYWLRDGDAASNQHGWQWVAGCGTDAAPFFRVFNPTVQGKKFDPHGDYVREWIPQLRSLPGPLAHEPWGAASTLEFGPLDYPTPIVDHATERQVALDRYGVLPPAR